MNPELTQKELQAFVSEGKTLIWQYNTLYQIDFSENLGRGEYYLRPVHRRNAPIGVTRRGRYQAMTPVCALIFVEEKIEKTGWGMSLKAIPHNWHGR